MYQLAVLMTVYNRVDKTLVCLEKLFSAKGIGTNFSLNVFLVDDDSNDGTWKKISEKYPEVILVKGNGNLYWNRGMRLAWDTAVKFGEFDGFLWLNNDTYLYEDAIQKVLHAADSTSWNSIVCGSTCDPHSPGELTYGGCSINPNGNYHINYPNGSLQKCDIINGNFVLVPISVYNKVGSLDNYFSHAIGDNDYSLRAKKLGIQSYSIDFIGTCSKNSNLPVWKSSRQPITKRIKSLYHPLSGTPPVESFKFRYRHYGIFQGVKSFVSLHMKVFFPSFFNK